jgi:VCBS repeat-containing protein
MPPFFNARRPSSVAASCALLFSALFATAVPTAVNDAYTVAEDGVLNVTTGGTIVAASFNSGADGFTYLDGAFGTTLRPDLERGEHVPTLGDNGTGGIVVVCGPRTTTQGTTPLSGGWSRTFSAPVAGTYGINLRYRLLAQSEFENNEYQLALLEIDSTRYGTAYAAAANGVPAATALHRFIGNGNGLPNLDSGWQTFSQNITLSAGSHTIKVGLFINNSTQSTEYAETYFDDVVITSGSGALGVLSNDTGTEPVTAQRLTNPPNGSLTFNSDGTFVYTPNANFFGADSFTYRAVDPTGNSAPATVNITVTPVNDAPVANNDSYIGTEDTPLTVNAPGLLTNDTDLDGNPLTAALRSPPGKGQVTVNANGSFTYTPNANANGADSFSYRVNDGTANSADATVSLTINPVNDPPAGTADSYRTPVNTPLVVTLTDPSGQPTTTETLVAAGSPVPIGDPGEVDLPDWRYLDDGSDQGTAWRNPGFADASWSTGKADLGYGDDVDGRPERTVALFGPDSGNKYATTYFRTTFQVTDKSSLTNPGLLLMRDDAAVVYLNGSEIYRDRSANGFPDLPANPAYNLYANGTISNADEATLRDLTAPYAAQYLLEGTYTLAVEVHQATGGSSDMSMDVELTAERGPYAGVLYNDLEADGQLMTAQLITPPASGSLTLNTNGTFTYTPAANFTGIVSFVYRASDGALQSANTTVTITVASAGNAPPLAQNEAFATNEDTALSVAAPGVLANDSDPEGGALTAQLVTGPAHGVLTLNDNGSFLYTPAANFFGPDSFTYRARDPFNANSQPATVTLTVNPVNDAPVAAADSYGTNPGATLTVSAAQGVLANDTDVDGSTLTASVVTPPVSGTLTLNTNGSFTYVPPAGFSGVRTFTYRASDGAAFSNTVTVTIAINGAPVAGANSYTTAEDTPLTVNAPGVLANDSDPEGQPITAMNVTQPSQGSVALNANGSFTYTPAANFFGSDSFTYQASDGVRVSAPATVSLTVTPVNDAPVANNDSYTGLPGQTFSATAALGVLANDSDAENSPLTLTQLSAPASGVLNLAADGSFTFMPNTGFTGTDTFTYRVSDGLLNSAPAVVTLNIEQPGDDIVINEIFYRPGGGYPENTSLEWIELHNRGTTTIDLTGWTISSGLTFAFPAGRTMAPGSYLVIAASVPAFQTAYPGVANVIGGWTGTLSNGGERIRLTDNLGNNQDEVIYASEGDWATRVRETQFNGWEWSTLADGGGRSMELRNPQISNDNGQNWSVSQTVGGTPGQPNVALTGNVPPIVKAVKHSPPVPTSTDRVRISCELNDESAFSSLNATLFWRNATTTTPGAWQQVPMSQDGRGEWFAQLEPLANLAIVEFYISATDGTNTRTWPAPTSEGQNANCQYQVSNEAVSPTAETVRLTLTAAENAAFNGVNSNSDRQFNTTLIIIRGQESEIRYRCDMRIRGNSSRNYQFRPLRINLPSDDDLDGSTRFNLHPRNPHLQHLGMRLFQAAGLRAPDTIPVELRRNGTEQTTSTGSTPDFGMWVRVEDLSGEMVDHHWPEADTGGIYKKGRNDYYWRATANPPNNPDGQLDGWLKQNNSAANDWSDLTNFFDVWMAASAPHFPGSDPEDVAGTNGSSSTGNGNWAGTAFSAAQIASVDTVADLEQWARWFAVMTILQDNETNVSNGQDDDYGAYFMPRTVGITPQRRLQFIPHDLDTIFGLGDGQLAFNARGLYDMTDNNFVFRPLLPLFGNNSTPGNAAFLTMYHNALRELLGTVFDADNSVNPNPPFYQTVDYHLGNWSSAANRNAIKNFVTQRRTYLLGLIGAGATTPPAGTSNATVTSAHGSLYISELMTDNVTAYNHSGTFPDVIEIHNTGGSTVNLAGMSLTDDPLVKAKYVFPSGASIGVGERLVIFADSAATPGLHTGFGLDNDGGVVQLYNTVAAGQALIDTVTYGLQPPDFSIGRTGAGFTTWALCTPTVGAANTAVAALADPSGLRINEFLGNADYRAADDFIELYNPAAQPVALGGMSLTDDFINYPARHVLPPLSFMAAGAFVEFEAKGDSATPGNAREMPFNIDSTVGSVAVLGANGTVVDRGETLPQFRDVSIGRIPDGSGVFTSMAPPTPGYSNAALPDGSLELLNFLRITELMFHPAGSTQSEYIEFRNISDLLGSPVLLDLSGVAFKNGITYTFPAGTTLAPGAFLILAENAANFSAQFPAVTVFGTYTGRLDNGGERLRFDLPGLNIPILDFTYNDSWYPSTDGGGDALQIVSATASPAMWDRSEGWQASPANPGSVPAYSIYAGADFSAPAGVPVFLDGALSPGTFTPVSSIALQWTRDSGPAAVTFTTPACEDANAVFPSPGVYVLRLTATAPGPTIVTDLVTVSVYETYDSWAATALAGQSPANRLPTADPDNDGTPNVAEWILGGNALNGGITGQPVPVSSGGLFAFTWKRNLTADPNVQIVPELSTDLITWQSGPAVLTTVAGAIAGNLQNWTATEVPAGRIRAQGRVRIVMP